jgi:hypothetical protein
MAAELVNASLGATVERGGWPAIGPKVGLLQQTIDLDDVTYSEAGDWINVFTFNASTVVLACGVYVTTGTTGACDLTLGTGGNNSLLTATSIASTGTEIVGTATTSVAFAANAILTAAFSASPAGGALRIWALVLDRGDVTG